MDWDIKLLGQIRSGSISGGHSFSFLQPNSQSLPSMSAGWNTIESDAVSFVLVAKAGGIDNSLRESLLF